MDDSKSEKGAQHALTHPLRLAERPRCQPARETSRHGKDARRVACGLVVLALRRR